MIELPSYYPFANAKWEEKLAWLDAEATPYTRIFEAAPWYTRHEQVDWYLEGIREARANPALVEGVRRIFGPVLDRPRIEHALQPTKGN